LLSLIIKETTLRYPLLEQDLTIGKRLYLAA
jgi:hypothetical protein